MINIVNYTVGNLQNIQIAFTTLASLISKQGIIRIGCIKDWQIELKNSIHLAGIFLDEIEFPKDFLFE